MFKKIVSKFVGDPNKKIIQDLQPLVDEIGAYEPELQTLTDEELRERSASLRQRFDAGETFDDLMAEAFALVREASVRTIGLRHYDVQLMGGALLHRGEVVEMRTGEGKTLVATLPLYLNALTGEGVHLVTVNEYLARRDGGWMGNVFHLLGLSVACIGPQQFSAIFDPEYVNPGAELEDERLVHWRPGTRREAYEADITYGISSEFGFDYLRDNMATSQENLVQRDLNYAIIDEVDNVLIDEARTPLIISGPAPQTGKEYSRFAGYVRNLRENTAGEEEEPNGHYDIDEKSRSISLTDMGIAEIEKRIEEINEDAGESLYDPRFYHLTYYLDNALRAQYLFKKDVQYVVQDGQVIIVDDFTGRLMPGRRYSDGLHEAIEAKEGVTIKRETITVATITLQNYFRLYEKLAGMTGTALTDAEEFDEIYDLGVTPLPTNVEYIVDTGELGLITDQIKVENSDAVRYLYPATKEPAYFKRIDFKDQIYATAEAKDQAIIAEIKRIYEEGRPVLVGTTSVEHSERIHRMLNKDKIPNSVLNAKMHQSEALVVAQAGKKGAVTISTNMAGRGTDILLGGNPEGLAADMVSTKMFDQRQFTQLAQRLLTEGPENATEFATKSNKLSADLVDWLEQENNKIQTALPEVEELGLVRYVTRKLYEDFDLDYNVAEQVVTRAQIGDITGAREQLTELGLDVSFADQAAHELDILRNYSTILNQRNASLQQKNQALADVLGQLLFEEHYNARAALIRAVLGGDNELAARIAEQTPGMSPDLIDQINEIKVQTEIARKDIWSAGGLHVVGSERHESRRIDNQLRGRAARQGDPGSSRFFLSLEDDLMRRFGGERLKSFMTRTSIPDDMPIENSMLDRIIENSQERIEGYNFDIRKNVVEYDDVMSKQRQAIYGDRRKILLGQGVDLDERISEAFDIAIDDLVNHYIIDYPGFMRSEIERVISDFSTDATDTINLTGVIRSLRAYLPRIIFLDRSELEGLSPEQLADRLMLLAYENEERGDNLYQLLQAMGRFLPILPSIPNLSGLAKLRSGQLQTRDRMKREYILLVDNLYNDFLAQQIPVEKREEIWNKAKSEIETAFDEFRTDNLTVMTAGSRQAVFRRKVESALRNLLLESLSALDGDQLITALGSYVSSQQEKWKERIGPAEFDKFQRQLLLSAIDNEWRDYLTAMDDLRREIGLAALGQRDPKVEYKKRSYAMFTNMRENIQKDIADRFFRQIANHLAFVERQQAEVNYKLQAQSAGYRVVSHGSGKGKGVERVTAKVGRNDPCPCGSGKKYKQCHGRASKAGKSQSGNSFTAQASRSNPQKKKKRRKR
jgi:preprotein translocase subunit SecA